MPVCLAIVDANYHVVYNRRYGTKNCYAPSAWGREAMATIKDIARRTGLGLATISKYLNGGTVRPQNKAAIEEAIKALDYTVNQHARGLKTNRSMTIGAVIPELNNTFITTIMNRASDELRAHGYALIIQGCRSDAAQEREAMRFLLEKRVDGIINMPVSRDGTHLRPVLTRGIPVVLIDRSLSDVQNEVSSVLVDNVSVSAMAVRQLLELGHRRIGIVVGPQDVFTSQQRLMGYNQAFEQLGLVPDPGMIVYGDYQMRGGRDAAHQLIARGATAIFATNYEMTLGALIAINDMGISMPGELSFIGFDNMQLSEVYRPRLNIVAQPLDAIGESCARLLLERLEDKQAQPRGVVLPAELLNGASIAAPGI